MTLRGAVDITSQRDAVERIALHVSGVSEVRNRLKVWIAVSTEDVAEGITDTIVGADGITVKVCDNVVTLTESAPSGDDRDAAGCSCADAGRRRPQ